MTKSAMAGDGAASVAETARFLGISATKAYELIKSRSLSHAIVGGKIVVPRAAAQRYLQERIVLGTVA